MIPTPKNPPQASSQQLSQSHVLRMKGTQIPIRAF